jgi:hypothetical protein
LAPTVEMFSLIVSVISLYASFKAGWRYQGNKLREYISALIHTILIIKALYYDKIKTNSNRCRQKIRSNPIQTRLSKNFIIQHRNASEIRIKLKYNGI